MASVTVVKLCLTVYCRRFKNEIIRAYAQDHFFDVITNTIGLATALLAIRFYWWLDPLGAILVSSPHTTFISVSQLTKHIYTPVTSTLPYIYFFIYR